MVKHCYFTVLRVNPLKSGVLFSTEIVSKTPENSNFTIESSWKFKIIATKLEGWWSVKVSNLKSLILDKGRRHLVDSPIFTWKSKPKMLTGQTVKLKIHFSKLRFIIPLCKLSNKIKPNNDRNTFWLWTPCTCPPWSIVSEPVVATVVKQYINVWVFNLGILWIKVVNWFMASVS